MTDFDAAAATWDQDPIKSERARTIAAAILKRLPLDKTMRAMEYGAGTGLLGFALQPHVGEVVLADVAPGMLSVARAKIAQKSAANMSVVRLDLETEALPQRCFDLVVMMMTLHHIADTSSILDKFYALLNPGGHLCIADLDREDGSFHGPGFTGHLGFDRAELTVLLGTAGFADIHFETVYHMRRTVDNAMRSFPIFLMTAQK